MLKACLSEGGLSELGPEGQKEPGMQGSPSPGRRWDYVKSPKHRGVGSKAVFLKLYVHQSIWRACSTHAIRSRPRKFNSVGLEWGLGIVTSKTFPDDTDAAELESTL